MPKPDYLKGRVLYDALMAMKPDELLEGDWATGAGLNRGFFTDLKKAAGGAPRSDTLRKLLSFIGSDEAALYRSASQARLAEPLPATSHEILVRRLLERATPEQLVQISGLLNGTAKAEELAAEQLDLVGIQQIDLAYGMGATFADGPVESELLRFPRSWVQAITSSPPALLTWASGRGDSMAPTIHDGDIVLLDRSQRQILEQDALWAFTVGDLGAIKRLRVKGDRVVILSDNPSVPPDEEPANEVNIVARVIFIGRRT
ncbi:MAG: S24 family peptidase [Sphingomonas sp.]|uniref:S24 family peptidase n=1 Tax=Sphingomonas TaxID=13687 RepID=UPI000AC1BBDB|nr:MULTISPECIES: S24 family peptidase [Sphingomonas]MCM2300687.1 S24 family peptidase [Sphingomonas sp.]